MTVATNRREFLMGSAAGSLGLIAASWRTGAAYSADPDGSVSLFKENLLPVNFAASAEEFLKTWKVDDWNTFKIRCVGKYPRITTWINGTKICAFDAATFKADRYDRDAVLKLLGGSGRIALEVHDGDEARWAKGAVSRWRNIRLKPL